MYLYLLCAIVAILPNFTRVYHLHKLLYLQVMHLIKTSLIPFLKKYRTSQLVVAFMLFWIPVIIFLSIAGEILERQPIVLDVQILTWIHAGSTPVLDAFFLFITSLGNAQYMLPITMLVILYLVYKGQRLNALIVTFGVGGAAAANLVLKLLFHRDRPTFWHSLITETGYSFPSGHAMLSSALILCIIALLWKTKWRTVSIVLGTGIVGLISYSRLYLGVHYPTDIVAGWSVSLLWVGLVLVVVEFVSIGYIKRRKHIPFIKR
jgi:membrane-associated phospholipid phosphatase